MSEVPVTVKAKKAAPKKEKDPNAPKKKRAPKAKPSNEEILKMLEEERAQLVKDLEGIDTEYSSLKSYVKFEQTIKFVGESIEDMKEDIAEMDAQIKALKDEIAKPITVQIDA